MEKPPPGRNRALWTEDSFEDFNPEKLSVEYYRIWTFTNCQSDGPNMAYDMAKEGFFYTGIGDTVECFCCHKQISDWHRCHNPATRHRQISPRCPMVRGCPSGITGNVEHFVDIRAQPASRHAPIVNSSSSSSSGSDGDEFDDSSGAVGEPPDVEGAVGYSKTTHVAERQLLPDDDTRTHEEEQRSSSLKDEKRRLEALILAKEKCWLCRSKAICIVLLPCRHMVVCEDCSVGQRRCPVMDCHKKVRKTIRAYRS